ncbi:MAG: GIY-YIG nuclease family protein [Patescibacteria group bacterium]|nr:GIY-YIG nuclease family protein [Patescibacteria group bacterium]
MLEEKKEYLATDGKDIFIIHPSKKYKGCWWGLKIVSGGIIEFFNRPFTEMGIRMWIENFIPSSFTWSSIRWSGNDFDPNKSKRRIRPKSDVVYFIEAEGLNRVKIGRCEGSPISRISSLQCGSPVKLKLVATVRGGCKKEGMIHKMFSKFSIHGEWFHFSEPIKQYISQNL